MGSQPDFDIYPNLDRDIQSARAVSDEEIATDALKNVIEVADLDNPTLEDLPEDIERWARQELTHALGQWQQYSEIFDNYDTSLPRSLEELELDCSNLVEKMRWLHAARISLFGEQNSYGGFVGETMHLVLIPWRLYDRSQADLLSFNGGFEHFVAKLRDRQGLIGKSDYIDQQLAEAIDTQSEIYFDPDDHTRLISTQDYLEKKITSDGLWGVMLMQTSNIPGALTGLVLDPKSPREINGNGHLVLQKTNVDAMGIYEWLALTLQENPREISKCRSSRRTHLSNDGYPSWLLANRIPAGPNKVHTPYVFTNPKVQWKITVDTAVKTNRYPRLAVA